MNLDLNVKKRKIGFSYAWSGLKEVFKEERNFRIHLAFAIMVMLFAGILRFTPLEWAILILVIGQVLVAEVINSVVERMVDYFKPEQHLSAKYIKDVSAAAVLIAAIIAVIAGFLLYIPKLYTFF